MKYQILIKILMLLLAKRKVTAKEIADRYEISRRTAYRYLEELIVAGIPIDIARGCNGGVMLADTYRLPVGFFTKDEYEATINALSAMLLTVEQEPGRTALEKLQRQTKQERHDLSLCGSILVDGSAWGDGKKFSDKMQVCQQAVEEGKQLEIDYIDRDGKHSVRRIDPHLLILKQNVWYVYAYCHTRAENRTFKIARIKWANFTGKTFEKKTFKREDIPLNFVYTPDEFVEVKLSVATNALPDVEEWIGVDNLEPCGKGLVARVTLPKKGLVEKILGFGGSVKILEPTSLAEEVKQTARKFLD